MQLLLLQAIHNIASNHNDLTHKHSLMKTSNSCPNCYSSTKGQYCSKCGQKQAGINRFFLTLVNEALEDVFSADSRVWRTLSALLFRPGFLSLEYVKGRRARYVQPIRLYFISSVLFFVVLTLFDFFGLTNLTTTHEATTKPNIEQSSAVNSATSNRELEGISKQAGMVDEPAPTPKPTDIDDIELSLPFLSEEKQVKLKTLYKKQLSKAKALVEADSGAFIPALLELSPPIIFCLLPLFALLLKLGYLGRGLYYAEHLILALHNHSFVFLWLTLYTLLSLALKQFPTVWSSLSLALGLWVPLYLWLSLKVVFGQGAIVTSIKYFVLGFTYAVMLGGGIGLALLIGVLTL